MHPRLVWLMAIAFIMQSCSTEEVPSVQLYSNSFDDDTSLEEFTRGFGNISIETGDEAKNATGCLSILGWCPAPNLSREIGPFDQDFIVYMEAWIKTDYGAAIHLNRAYGAGNYVRIETKDDLFEARKWNHYTSGVVLVPEGETVHLYFDASNSTVSNTFIDDLIIYGRANE